MLSRAQCQRFDDRRPQRHIGRRTDETHRLRGYESAQPTTALQSGEEEIRRMRRRSVVERDEFVVQIEARMDHPLIGRTDLRECRALGGRAEARELYRVTEAGTIAVEVVENVAV